MVWERLAIRPLDGIILTGALSSSTGTRGVDQTIPTGQKQLSDSNGIPSPCEQNRWHFPETKLPFLSLEWCRQILIFMNSLSNEMLLKKQRAKFARMQPVLCLWTTRLIWVCLDPALRSEYNQKGEEKGKRTRKEKRRGNSFQPCEISVYSPCEHSL